jgi:hypothetical protein
MKSSRTILSNSEKILRDSENILINSEKILRNSEKILRNLRSNDLTTAMKRRFEQIFFLLSFLEKFLVDFFEIFLNNLNDTRINSLNDFLFRDDAFEVVDRVNCDVLDVSVTASTDDDLNCLKIFLRFFNHSTKFVVFRVIARIAELNDR